jgi:hypothetical protein
MSEEPSPQRPRRTTRSMHRTPVRLQFQGARDSRFSPIRLLPSPQPLRRRAQNSPRWSAWQCPAAIDKAAASASRPSSTPVWRGREGRSAHRGRANVDTIAASCDAGHANRRAARSNSSNPARFELAWLPCATLRVREICESTHSFLLPTSSARPGYSRPTRSPSLLSAPSAIYARSRLFRPDIRFSMAILVRAQPPLGSA